MKKLESLPENPGCYLFKDSEGKVIYVGKAKSLARRVKNYFIGKHEEVRTNILISKIKDIDFIVTDSEVEALILENNLIKKYKPKYNIDLKDSKRYAYIQVTDEEFPRLVIARKREGGGKFFGPFISGISRDYILNSLQRIFKTRTCRKLPKRKCMRLDIGLCSGPCVGKISRREYLEDVKNAEMVLKGRTKRITDVLTKKMRTFSGEQNFEGALIVREQIKAIRNLSERQKMERGKKYDEDFVNYIVDRGRVYLILFNAKKGILENKHFFEFDWSPDFLEEFLVQFYSSYDVPQEVVLPEKVDSSLKKFLEKVGGGKVRISVPKIGEKKELLDLVRKNVEISVFGDEDKIESLREKLGLGNLPKVIECFDVSHLAGTDSVASMVQFRSGKADRSGYRRFKIRSVKGVDDYASMYEVVGRRYKKILKEKGEFPDLIIIDGGRGQLSVAVRALRDLGIRIPIIGIAKREEEIILPELRSEGDLGFRVLKLDRRERALKLIQEIRDEAHRFAISYNRLLRSKRIRK